MLVNLSEYLCYWVDWPAKSKPVYFVITNQAFPKTSVLLFFQPFLLRSLLLQPV